MIQKITKVMIDTYGFTKIWEFGKLIPNHKHKSRPMQVVSFSNVNLCMWITMPIQVSLEVLTLLILSH